MAAGAHVDLGLTEDLRRGLADQQTCEGEKIVGDSTRQRVRENLGFDFLIGGERRHGNPPRTAEVDFAPQRRFPGLCTKIPPTGNTLTPSIDFEQIFIASDPPLRYPAQ